MDIQALSEVYLIANARHLPVLRALGDDPADCTVVTGYDILDGNEKTLGNLEVQHVKFGSALNVGESFFDVADCISGDIFDIYQLMYDVGTSNVAATFEEAMAEHSGCPDVWYIPTDEVFDHAWGRKALHILAQHAESSLGFIVVGVSDLMNPASDKAHTRAKARVAALQRMGFLLYENSPFMFLSTAMRLAPFKEKGRKVKAVPELADA